MRLLNFRLLTPLLLPLGSLPTAHQFPAERVLAVALVPAPGLIDLVTPATQAHPPAQAAAPGRKEGTESML
jgi:hypothetical protein